MTLQFVSQIRTYSYDYTYLRRRMENIIFILGSQVPQPKIGRYYAMEEGSAAQPVQFQLIIGHTPFIHYALAKKLPLFFKAAKLLPISRFLLPSTPFLRSSHGLFHLIIQDSVQKVTSSDRSLTTVWKVGPTPVTLFHIALPYFLHGICLWNYLLFALFH